MDLLNTDTILQSLNHTVQNEFELELHQQLDSTNSYLLNQKLADKVQICLAESQTDGRGRHGKSWYSPMGANIYISFAHRLKLDMSALSGLSLAVGITLTETLQPYCEDLIQVKWPNDLLVNGNKLSGILVEIKNEGDGLYKIIIGLGINIAMPETAENVITQTSISLNQCNPVKELSRNEIVADLIINILESVKSFENLGFEKFHHKWNKLDAWYEQPVVLKIGSKKIIGIHRGIDLSGALLLEQQGKLTSWSSGEVSLRRAS